MIEELRRRKIEGKLTRQEIKGNWQERSILKEVNSFYGFFPRSNVWRLTRILLLNFLVILSLSLSFILGDIAKGNYISYLWNRIRSTSKTSNLCLLECDRRVYRCRFKLTKRLACLIVACFYPFR